MIDLSNITLFFEEFDKKIIFINQTIVLLS
jgi:hypothetical protein